MQELVENLHVLALVATQQMQGCRRIARILQAKQLLNRQSVYEQFGRFSIHVLACDVQRSEALLVFDLEQNKNQRGIEIKTQNGIITYGSVLSDF